MTGFRDLGFGIYRGDLALSPHEARRAQAARTPELQISAVSMSGPVYDSSAVPPTEGSRLQPAPSTKAGK